MTLKGRCCCWRRKKGESLTGEQSLAPEVQRSRRQERARTHVRTSREEDGRLVSSTSVGPASRDSHNHHPRVHRARARNSLTGMEGGGLLPSPLLTCSRFCVLQEGTRVARFFDRKRTDTLNFEGFRQGSS
ncbi:hypothetical protein HZH66_012159 [Vespula vulgaris]|uniref:Uncharacterized protein n=2 Tax=Vespula TaxID=7451 RepID=A0A834JBD4_VESVU|nr:hypothetical protein HZH66_012159 [Vespula vulgaris]